MSETWRLDLGIGLRRLSGGGLTAREWVRALTARIERFDHMIKAWVALDRSAALAAAEVIDAGRAAGRAPGPLAGAPIGVKDLIAVKGLAWEAGSPLFAGRVAETDAPAVARLRAQGAIVMGKTTTCELGSNWPSQTRNPWNPLHSPGGSSSGSAAAVAAGMVPAALGTQTGGSILRPAAYCGVLGFKPTYGRISRSGVVPLAWSADHLGVLSRSVRDAAQLFAAMAGAGDAECAARRPRRVLFLKDDFLPRAAPEVADWTLRAVDRLTAAGIAVDAGRLPEDLDSVHGIHRVVVRAEAAAYHADRFQERPEAFGPDIRNGIVSGLMVPAAHYLRALRLRSRFVRRMDRLCDRYDLVVAPATPETAPLAEVSTGSPLFNEPCSISGHPAITLPLGRGDNNLPVGIQLIGSRDRDEDLLAAARWCELELGWRAEIAEMEEPPERKRGSA